MRWYTGAYTPDRPTEQPWVKHQTDNKVRWVKTHRHILPLGFPRLAIMQQKREKRVAT
jgi:hypothetical protein